MQGRSSDTNTHIVPDLCLRTNGAPNTHLIQAAYPPLVDIRGTTKLKVSKSNKSRVALGGDTTLSVTIDIERKGTSIDNHCDMVPPLGSREYVRHIQTV